MKFDYVIAGAGSAGSVLASRLSEAPDTTVLLLEAGGPGGSFWERIPLGVGKLLNDDRQLWRLNTTPSGEDNGVPVEWVSGRCLGGSSAVNGMLFVRGHPEMYDKMAEEGCDGWSYADCLPYFRKLEDCQFGSSAERGRGGPISSSRVEADPISDAFLAGWSELGVPVLDDYNASGPDGAGYLQVSIRNGRRSGAADGYIRPARTRPNLTVLTGAVAQKVVFRGEIATGVVFTHNGKTMQAEARRETILCAGAVRTPQLLELSGVGNKALLEELGIPVVLDRNEVGENLQDHLMARICFETNQTATLNHMLSHRAAQVKEALKYMFLRTGQLSSSSLKSTAFVRSDPSLPSPDLRIQVGLLSASSRVPVKGQAAFDPVSAFHVGVYGLYPKSRGSTHIQTANVAKPPKVMPNYLRDESDCHALVAGLQLIRTLAETGPMSAIIRNEIRPTAAVAKPDELLKYAKATGSTCWHPAGTCRMGSDPSSIVDPQCRVRGLEKLRVIDASVFPHLTSSNTNIPVIMLAEKMAALMQLGRE
jgi:choline dehydrogenase